MNFNAFNRAHQDVKIPPVVVSLSCIGYEAGNAVVSSANFHESSSNRNFEPYNNPINSIAHPGLFVPLAENKVCNDLLSGSSPTLKHYRERDVVHKYRRALEQRNFLTVTTSDLIELSKTCLAATESKEGLKFDPYAKFVGPPNQYAVISPETGFRFLPDH